MGLLSGTSFFVHAMFTPGGINLPFGSIGTVLISQYSIGPSDWVIFQSKTCHPNVWLFHSLFARISKSDPFGSFTHFEMIRNTQLPLFVKSKFIIYFPDKK